MMLCLAALVGEVLVLGQLPTIEFALLTFFPPFFISLSSFAMNDLLDLEADRANRRFDRPLVLGTVKPWEARFLAVFGFIVGVGSAALINVAAFAIALVFGLLGLLYSFRLKWLPLVGNTFIAFSMAVPFVFGNMAVSAVLSQSVVILALIAFVAGLAREVMKTVQDLEGDMLAGRGRTLPMIVGAHLSLMYASLLFIIAVLVSFIPFLYVPAYRSDFNYLAPIVIADSVFIYVALRIVYDAKEFLPAARSYTLVALFFGLLGFLAGALF